MRILSVGVFPPKRPSHVASASVKLVLDGGGSITINDLRILRNRRGGLWVANPSYSELVGDVWEHKPTVVVSPDEWREIEEEVLAEYEAHAEVQGARP